MERLTFALASQVIVGVWVLLCEDIFGIYGYFPPPRHAQGQSNLLSAGLAPLNEPSGIAIYTDMRLSGCISDAMHEGGFQGSEAH